MAVCKGDNNKVQEILLQVLILLVIIPDMFSQWIHISRWINLAVIKRYIQANIRRQTGHLDIAMDFIEYSDAQCHKTWLWKISGREWAKLEVVRISTKT
jgi:hypothetical protein